MENVPLSVTDFVALVNQTLEYAYPTASVIGEVSEFRVNQGKWVSFKLKDGESIVDCFTTVFQLRVPLEDGMKIMVIAAPRVNAKWGKFSLSIRTVKLVGEGSIKKGFELLKEKLEKEGLFSPERKRPLPQMPTHVGVITSAESAAYADFCKIVNDRWGGLKVTVAHTQVQGQPAADQIIGAIRWFNRQEELPEVLVVIRGGGSAEDLQTFNDEQLAREIAGSRIPMLVGVGHEIDHTLSDMVADVRAATPTNAAEILVPDKREVIRMTRHRVVSAGTHLTQIIEQYQTRIGDQKRQAVNRIEQRLAATQEQLQGLRMAVAQLNPERVLKQGYALVRGTIEPGEMIEIELYKKRIQAEVKDVRNR